MEAWIPSPTAGSIRRSDGSLGQGGPDGQYPQPAPGRQRRPGLLTASATVRLDCLRRSPDDLQRSHGDHRGGAAIAKDDLLVRTANYIFLLSVTGWGWIHLILGRRRKSREQVLPAHSISEFDRNAACAVQRSPG
ncbi:DUF7144 family membrane protein [Kitasatospora sp. NPDC054939]